MGTKDMEAKEGEQKTTGKGVPASVGKPKTKVEMTNLKRNGGESESDKMLKDSAKANENLQVETRANLGVDAHSNEHTKLQGTVKTMPGSPDSKEEQRLATAKLQVLQHGLQKERDIVNARGKQDESESEKGDTNTKKTNIENTRNEVKKKLTKISNSSSTQTPLPLNMQAYGEVRNKHAYELQKKYNEITDRNVSAENAQQDANKIHEHHVRQAEQVEQAMNDHTLGGIHPHLMELHNHHVEAHKKAKELADLRRQTAAGDKTPAVIAHENHLLAGIHAEQDHVHRIHRIIKRHAKAHSKGPLQGEAGDLESKLKETDSAQRDEAARFVTRHHAASKHAASKIGNMIKSRHEARHEEKRAQKALLAREAAAKHKQKHRAAKKIQNMIRLRRKPNGAHKEQKKKIAQIAREAAARAKSKRRVTFNLPKSRLYRAHRSRAAFDTYYDVLYG